MLGTYLYKSIRGVPGSGKTVVCVQDMVFKANMQPPVEDPKTGRLVRWSNWALVRQTFSALKESTIKTWTNWFPLGDMTEVHESPPIKGRFEAPSLRGDGTWVEVSTGDINLEDYAKKTEVENISARVGTLEEIGAEKNIIQSVDVGTLNITEDRKLELKAVPQNIVTGLTKTSWTVQKVEDGDDIFIAQTTVANLEDILKPATFDPTTKTGTSGLMTAEQVQKLQALVITDEGIQVSGKVNADNVEGLSTWITTNRNTIEGLYPVEAKNLLDSLNKLVTDETNGLNVKIDEHDSRIAEMEEVMTWGSL
jgi:hypothetical protein